MEKKKTKAKTKQRKKTEKDKYNFHENKGVGSLLTHKSLAKCTENPAEI